MNQGRWNRTRSRTRKPEWIAYQSRVAVRSVGRADKPLMKAGSQTLRSNLFSSKVASNAKPGGANLARCGSPSAIGEEKRLKFGEARIRPPGKENNHDRLHCRMGAYAIRQARR